MHLLSIPNIFRFWYSPLDVLGTSLLPAYPPPFIFRFGFCAGRCRLVAPSLRRLMLAKIFIIRCFLREILTMCRHATFCPFLQKILKMDGRLPLSERSLHSYMPPFGWLLPSSNIIFDYFFYGISDEMDIIPIMVASGSGLILLFSIILFSFMTLGSVDDL